MIITASLDINPAALHDAAAEQGMTPAQFVAWATNNAIETHNRREALLQALRDVILDNADTEVVPA